MFYYIEGTVEVIGQNLAVLDAGGVGFMINTTVNTLSRIEMGKRARLYTYSSIREDAFDIYGFYDLSEKKCFEMLVSVSGVGPKAALSIHSTNTPEGLTMAIITENEKALTAAPGIGKRIAQRIILELKDKMAKENPVPATGSFVAPAAVSEGKLSEAVAALMVLGYSQAEINAGLAGADISTMTLEEIIRHVLKGSLK